MLSCERVDVSKTFVPTFKILFKESLYARFQLLMSTSLGDMKQICQNNPDSMKDCRESYDLIIWNRFLGKLLHLYITVVLGEKDDKSAKSHVGGAKTKEVSRGK